jgi:antitoxin MazE
MQVSKWGNSLAVRLPGTIVKTLKLKSGDEVEIVLHGERVFEVERDRSRERAFVRLRALKKPLPKGSISPLNASWIRAGACGSCLRVPSVTGPRQPQQ